MCTFYRNVINPDIFGDMEKCRNQSNPYSACNCYYNAFDCLNPSNCTVGDQTNCQCFCDVNKSQFCSAYENCGTYPLLSIVNCPGGGYSEENYTLYAPCYKDEKEELAEMIADKLEYQAQVMGAMENLLIPTNCIQDLQAEAYQLNQQDLEIQNGCKAPYDVLEENTTISEYVTANKGCLTCGLFEVKQNVTIYTVGPIPDWQPPNPLPPECSPPPPPSPPPPITNPESNCLNGGGF